METGKYPPICIFAEGGSHNGSHLLQFKRGAFTALLPITPYVMKYQWDMFCPTFDVLTFIPFAVLHLCSFGHRATLHKFPVFVPNDYLFKTHEDKVLKSLQADAKGPKFPAVEKWEIYAWALRDIMSKEGKIPMSNDQTQAMRLQYKAIMGVRPEKSTKSE